MGKKQKIWKEIRMKELTKKKKEMLHQLGTLEKKTLLKFQSVRPLPADDIIYAWLLREKRIFRCKEGNEVEKTKVNFTK